MTLAKGWLKYENWHKNQKNCGYSWAAHTLFYQKYMIDKRTGEVWESYIF
jgi:hypothetical protein